MPFQERFKGFVTEIEQGCVVASDRLRQSDVELLSLDLGLGETGFPLGIDPAEIVVGNLTRDDLVFPQYGHSVICRERGLTNGREDLRLKLQFELFGTFLIGSYHDARIGKFAYPLDEVASAVGQFENPYIARLVDDVKFGHTVTARAGVQRPSRREPTPLAEIDPEYFGILRVELQDVLLKIEAYRK